jgi:hypothetical protein
MIRDMLKIIIRAGLDAPPGRELTDKAAMAITGNNRTPSL